MSGAGEFRASEDWLARASACIPLASQTFSKSRTHLPVGAAPLFASSGEGAELVDLDGHRYLDFVNGLASVLIGYRDPDVDAAIRRQLEIGVTFSLPHPLEAEVAELLVERIPCAEAVRFGKNGSDATSAAVRLARAVTGRDSVAVCGYHGWHDWYIGSTARDLGVPKAISALTRGFPYDDIDALADLFGGETDFAAVIMEPMTDAYPSEGYLAAVKELCRRHGALLIFDETITGFRFDRGGAQKLFGVIPDLATFGKGLANGLPLSAVVGPRDLMRGMEEIFFSSTFGGETLSLAAAKAVLEKLDRCSVPEHLERCGERILGELPAIFSKFGLGDHFRVSGHPAWTFLHVRGSEAADEWLLRTLLLQELVARGVLCLGTHNLSFAHGDGEVERLLRAYEGAFGFIEKALASGEIESRLRGERLEPLFRVRTAGEKS